MILSVCILFVSALLCLILESLGINPAQRKTGNRYYIVLIATAGVLLAGYYLPTQLIFGICTFVTLMSLIVGVSQMHHSKLELGDAYALILVLHALLLLLCSSTNLIHFAVIGSFFNIALLGLIYFRKNRRLVAEVGIKFLFGSLFYFCFISMAIALCLQSIGSTEFSVIAAHPEAKFAIGFVWLAILLWIGTTPFLSTYVDFLDGAPSFASVLLLAGVWISGGSVLTILTQHALAPRLFEILVFLAGASLLIPPILGLDQRRIGRMVAYLLMTQSGLLLLLALFKVPVLPIFYLHIAMGIPGALAGIRFWKHSQNSDKNWEDYAGAGRKHPFVGFAWLFILGSFSGIPPTLGFWLYSQLAQEALKTGAYWVLPLIVLAIVASIIPIARLGIFMFSKPIRHEMIQLHQPRQAFLIIACAVLIFATKMICLAIAYSHELQDFMSQFTRFKF